MQPAVHMELTSNGLKCWIKYEKQTIKVLVTKKISSSNAVVHTELTTHDFKVRDQI